MTPKQHKEFFFDFLKGLFPFEYASEPVKGQEIVLLVEGEKQTEEILANRDKLAVIDPDWDAFYQSFIKIDYAPETVEYIKFQVETGKELALVKQVINYLIKQNINSDKVYVVIGKDWGTDWLEV
jgi:3-dehydroquinate synthetase